MDALGVNTDRSAETKGWQGAWRKCAIHRHTSPVTERSPVKSDREDRVLRGHRANGTRDQEDKSGFENGILTFNARPGLDAERGRCEGHGE